VLDVGSYADQPSYYGTFDQGGNVLEWMDGGATIGGQWYNGESGLRSTETYIAPYDHESDIVGFRLASAIPEPSGLLLSALAFLGCWRRRRE
jgi:formylglycine-generating enzyme required for sulfatase activity